MNDSLIIKCINNANEHHHEKKFTLEYRIFADTTAMATKIITDGCIKRSWKKIFEPRTQSEERPLQLHATSTVLGMFDWSARAHVNYSRVRL